MFGGFRLDLANRLLEREDVAIPIQSKVFDLLVVFAKNPGRLLEKEELIEKVWRQEFVEEGNLARHVSTLRKALGDNGKDRKFIVTVQGRGYRFVADVATVEAALQDTVKQNADPTTTPQSKLSKKWLWAIPAVALILASGWIINARFFIAGKTQIKSLAILPLRSFDKNDSYLGAGIADAVIRRIGQSTQLTVRPTSAVTKYLKDDTDSLTAARELNTDAVLEGTIQRANDRLRVSVNLLRTSDGASLWTDTFDVPSKDIFLMQDQVAQAVATRLELRFDPAQSLASSKYPTSPVAYEQYIKGVFSLDERGYGIEAMPQMTTTIGFFQKAIQLDPNYALAHAQLAFAYVWTALFIEPEEQKWAELAREEIKKSEEVDPQLAETHLVKALLLWSGYGGYQNDEAIRELLAARQINPATNHGELVALYAHVGLYDQAESELQRELEIDPTSQSLKDLTMIVPYTQGDADAWLVAHRKLSPTGRLPSWYLLRKGQWDEAQKVIDDGLARDAHNNTLLMQQELLFALKGDFRRAEKDLPAILAAIPVKGQNRHHDTYDAACIYALEGKSAEAVRWLNETAATGFPDYPLFEHDPFLDHIRKTPEFMHFLADEKTRWEKYRQEFGESR